MLLGPPGSRVFDVEPDSFLLEAAAGRGNLKRLARVLATVVLRYLFDEQPVGQGCVFGVRGEQRLPVEVPRDRWLRMASHLAADGGVLIFGRRLDSAGVPERDWLINYHFEGFFHRASTGVRLAGPAALVAPDDGLEDEQQRSADLFDVNPTFGVADDGVPWAAPLESNVRMGELASRYAGLVHKVRYLLVWDE